MARVLLIQPNGNREVVKTIELPYTPISLVYLGTAIEDKHQIKIFDRNLDLKDETLLNLIISYNPDIIGISSTTTEALHDIIYLGKLIKKNMPSKIIVVGGVHATIDPDSLLKEPYVDYVIRGEGESALLDFCNTFDTNPKELKNLMNINNNPLRPFIDMNELKLPNYNLIDLKKYDVFYINLSRGCPGNCTFCYSSKMWGKNGRPYIRALSTERAKEFFKELIEKYNIKTFCIGDDNFVPFKSRAVEICNSLEQYNLNFFCFGRSDYLDDRIIQALKKAGCHTIQIGVESGSQRILDFLNKKVKVQQNINAIECCKRNGIKVEASTMIGITSETIAEMNETVEFIKKYKPSLVSMRIFNPMPGTPLFEYCLEKKYFKKPETLEEWANWAGDFCTIKQNTSEIPDELLIKTYNELRKVGLIKVRLKRLLFWVKTGEFKYLYKRILFYLTRMK